MPTSISGTLITVAPTGAESAKADVPALPVTVEEVAATARDCARIGASVIHLHVRDAETRPTLDLARVREVVAAVRESTDLVVQLSSGGAVTDPFDARLAVLDAEPDAASLTLGTVNFGRDVRLGGLRPRGGDRDESAGRHRPMVADRTARTRSRAAARVSSGSAGASSGSIAAAEPATVRAVSIATDCLTSASAITPSS